MMIVDLQRLQEAVDYITIVNSVDLDQIEWRRDNKQVHIEPELIEEWKFIGLTNVTFARNYPQLIKDTE
jgi:hypothetical protein